MTMNDTAEIIVRVHKNVGRITLNRPKALHALTLGMCETMIDTLVAWQADPEIDMVMIDHTGERGFCAGGDIRMLAHSGAGDAKEARAFFHTEYQLNHLLFTYDTPVVAMLDGVVMGGGVGISMPAHFRIATERTTFAMPETGIGLFPDVGGGWYLSRLPGHIGEFVALTGARLDGGECLALGLATHFLPAGTLDEAKARIAADPQAIDAILDSLSAPTPGAKIAAHRADIDRLFSLDTLEEILAAIEDDDSDWAREQLATLRTKSPQSMKVSLHLVREGRHMPSFEDEMRQEFAVASRVVQRPDFVEGVRAVIVDKDNAPRWSPATPEDVTDHVINQIFAPLPDGQQWEPA